MKKIVIALIAVISAFLMCFGISACSDSDDSIEVAGKTYVFVSFDITYGDDVADEDKISDEDLNSTIEWYSQMEMTFYKDGTFIWGEGEQEPRYYVQDGTTVSVYFDEDDLSFVATVDGKKIVITTTEEDGGVITIVYKRK